MTALSAHTHRDVKPTTKKFVAEMPVAASQTIYNGALVSIDADGFIIPAADTASTLAIGYVDEGADNSSGADGAETVKVYTGTVRVATGTTAAANLGGLVYCEDDDTVDLVGATSNDIACGILVERISATEAFVMLLPTSAI